LDNILSTLKLGGLYKKTYEYVRRPIKSDEMDPFLEPFSKMTTIALRIIKKIHYKNLQLKEVLDYYDYRVITAYSKHKNIASSLVSS